MKTERVVGFCITLLALFVNYGKAVADTAFQPRRHVVAIQGFRFHPPRLAIALGDTVIWVNSDIVPHTVTADGEQWKSHMLQEGENWTMSITHRGIYSYYCEFHPQMTGILETR